MNTYTNKRRGRGENIISVRNTIYGVACYGLVVLLAIMVADMPRTAKFLIGLFGV